MINSQLTSMYATAHQTELRRAATQRTAALRTDRPNRSGRLSRLTGLSARGPVQLWSACRPSTTHASI